MIEKNTNMLVFDTNLWMVSQLRAIVSITVLVICQECAIYKFTWL